MLTNDSHGRIIVTAVTSGGRAEAAGVRVFDVVTGCAPLRRGGGPPSALGGVLRCHADLQHALERCHAVAAPHCVVMLSRAPQPPGGEAKGELTTAMSLENLLTAAELECVVESQLRSFHAVRAVLYGSLERFEQIVAGEFAARGYGAVPEDMREAFEQVRAILHSVHSWRELADMLAAEEAACDGHAARATAKLTRITLRLLRRAWLSGTEEARRAAAFRALGHHPRAAEAAAGGPRAAALLAGGAADGAAGQGSRPSELLADDETERLSCRFLVCAWEALDSFEEGCEPPAAELVARVAACSLRDADLCRALLSRACSSALRRSVVGLVPGLGPALAALSTISLATKARDVLLACTDGDDWDDWDGDDARALEAARATAAAAAQTRSGLLCGDTG